MSKANRAAQWTQPRYKTRLGIGHKTTTAKALGATYPPEVQKIKDSMEEDKRDGENNKK